MLSAHCIHCMQEYCACLLLCLFQLASYLLMVQRPHMRLGVWDSERPCTNADVVYRTCVICNLSDVELNMRKLQVKQQCQVYPGCPPSIAQHVCNESRMLSRTGPLHPMQCYGNSLMTGRPL